MAQDLATDMVWLAAKLRSTADELSQAVTLLTGNKELERARATLAKLMGSSPPSAPAAARDNVDRAIERVASVPPLSVAVPASKQQQQLALNRVRELAASSSTGAPATRPNVVRSASPADASRISAVCRGSTCAVETRRPRVLGSRDF